MIKVHCESLGNYRLANTMVEEVKDFQIKQVFSFSVLITFLLGEKRTILIRIYSKNDHFCIGQIIQLCGIVDGLREEQAWSILDSVSWSTERAVELALMHATEEDEFMPLAARDREISYRVLYAFRL